MKKIALIISVLFIISFSSTAQNIETLTNQVYEIVLQLGSNKIIGTLEMVSIKEKWYGKIAVNQPIKLNISLGEKNREGNQMIFHTSSPAAAFTLSLDPVGISGELSLNNGQQIPYTANPINASLDRNLKKVFQKKNFIAEALSLPNAGEAFPSITRDGNTIYFSKYESNFGEQTIMIATKQNGNWSKPSVAPFSGNYNDRSPFVSADGNTILFASKRPLNGSDEASKDYNIWMVKRQADGNWEEPIALTDLNSKSNEYQPCMVKDGSIYFSSDREGGMGGQDIYIARFKNGIYQMPENLGIKINTTQSEISAFVTPEEDLLFIATGATHSENIGNDDIFVCKRIGESWSVPINLGNQVNTFANEYGAFVSEDRKFLYYTSDANPPASIYKIRLKSLIR